MKIFLILAVILTSFFANEIAVAQDNDPVMARYEAGDGPYARDAWEQIASTGDFNSQVMLGMLYSGAMDPKGVEIDFEKARYWMRQAVAQREKSDNFDLATVLMGHAYQLETGAVASVVGPVEMGEVIEWYRLAADAGGAAAGLRLGQIYEIGRDGIAVDLVAALDWYEWAAPVVPVALMAAVRLNFDAGRIDRALYWLDRAWVINERGIETVWSHDPYKNEPEGSFENKIQAYLGAIYQSFYPDCLPGWNRLEIAHKMHTVSVGDIEVRRIGNEIHYPIGFFTTCFEEKTGATAMVWIRLHDANLAARWRKIIDEFNGLDYMQRERHWINGRYIQEVNGYYAATASRRDEKDRLITSFDAVLDDGIVITSELYGSLGNDFENREAALAYLSALDFQKIIDGTRGHGVFQVAEDGSIVKP